MHKKTLKLSMHSAIGIFNMDYPHSMNMRLLKIELDFHCSRHFTYIFRLKLVFKVRYYPMILPIDSSRMQLLHLK